MDMKRILQALDGAATKPVEGANDMKKFVSIIQEGANPHKVALPVQMTMQHYQAPATKKEEKQLTEKVSSLRSYFKLVESEQFDKVLVKDPAVVNRARIIAERIRLKEYSTDQLTRASVHNGPGVEQVESQDDLGSDTFGAMKHITSAFGKALGGDAVGGISDLATTSLTNLKQKIEVALAGGEYDPIQTETLQKQVAKEYKRLQSDNIPDDSQKKELEELKVAYSKLEDLKRKHAVAEGNDPCWKDYKMVGTKKKGGKTVPNCVPKK